MRRVFLITAFLLIVSMQSNLAQPLDCPAIVQQAIQRMADNCDALDRNSACYGYNNVSATFNDSVPEDFFTQPADRSELTTIQSIQTAELDESLERWGIAVLNAQANVPDVLPGQAVTFILMGDSQMQNRVDDPQPQVDPITVNVAQETLVRAEPDDDATVTGTLSTGTPLDVDAVDRRGEWLRVAYIDQPGWVRVDAVEPDSGIETLPDASQPTPMQAFYLQTGLGEPACAEAPDAVTIRSRENITVDLNVNGADIRVGSTITLHTPSADQLVISVQEGQVEVVDSEIVAQAGETIRAALDSDGTVTEWAAAQPATATEQALNTVADAMHNTLSGEATTQANETGEVIHIVATGETLYRIARNYDASLPAIVSRNAIQDPRSIRVGQRLVIPNPGSGFINLPTTGTPITAPTLTAPPGGETTVTGVDCGPFRATSPLDGLNYGQNTFFWDAPFGPITRYQVDVVNVSESIGVSFQTTGDETTVTGNVDNSNSGGGFDFRWRVQAFVNGVPVCTTPFVDMRRAAPGGGGDDPAVDPVPALPDFTASWSCGPDDDEATIRYSSVPAGQTVTITFSYLDPATGAGVPVNIGRLSAPSGSYQHEFIDGNTQKIFNGQVVTSGGLSVLLNPAELTC